METILEIDDIEKGTYSIKYEGIKSIELIKTEFDTDLNNVIELV